MLAIALLCIGLGLGGEAAREWGRFEREALQAGELWRLVTAHLVHLGWGHLWLNVLALGLMGLLFDRLVSPWEWLSGSILSAAGIDVGLYLMHVELGWYVGLSGVLHGLMVLGAAALARARSPIGYVLIIGVLGKLLWEQWQGPLPFSEPTSGGPVLVDAHLYGALGGLAALAITALRRRFRRRPS